MSEQEKVKAQPGVTPITSIRSYQDGKIIEIPPYSEGQPVFMRLRRPSLLKMAQAGVIPNALLKVATDLFTTGKAIDVDDPATLGQMYELTRIMVKACLVEPTFEDLEEAGVELTDDQLAYIFQYAQSGVDRLNSFRSE